MNREPQFYVEWTAGVSDLAEALATYFPSRNGWKVTRAEQIASELLGDDPERNGSPVAEGLFRLIVSPLIVYYEIRPVSLLVRILRVRHYPV